MRGFKISLMVSAYSLGKIFKLVLVKNVFFSPLYCPANSLIPPLLPTPTPRILIFGFPLVPSKPILQLERTLFRQLITGPGEHQTQPYIYPS